MGKVPRRAQQPRLTDPGGPLNDDQTPLADSSRDEFVAGPRGQRVWAGGDTVFTSDGFRLRIPNRFGRSRAAAWSPDEQWLALAAGDKIAFIRPGVDGHVVTVPIDAADLAWR